MFPVKTTYERPHVIPPDTYRAVVLARRIEASDSVAALIAELCFGTHREHRPHLSVSTVAQTQVRS